MVFLFKTNEVVNEYDVCKAHSDEDQSRFLLNGIFHYGVQEIISCQYS